MSGTLKADFFFLKRHTLSLIPFLPQKLLYLLLPQFCLSFSFFNKICSFSAYMVIKISNSAGEKQEDQSLFSAVATVNHVICYTFKRAFYVRIHEFQ